MILIAIGKQRGADADLFLRYAERLKPKLKLVELPDGTGAPVEIKRREAASLLACLTPQDHLIALDQDGKSLTSPQFAGLLTQLRDQAQNIVFAIGGAEGFDASIIARANMTLSFGTLTWPHMLARIMLAEQIYRAQCIAANHPYHRGLRP